MDGARKLLIVEDEMILAMDLKLMVEDSGYHVAGIAGTGEDAVRKAAETKPDVVLMDIALDGDVDGVETSIIILKELEIPTIFITGSTDQGTVDRAEKANPIGYLRKPVDVDMLSLMLVDYFMKSAQDRNLDTKE